MSHRTLVIDSGKIVDEFKYIFKMYTCIQVLKYNIIKNI